MEYFFIFSDVPDTAATGRYIIPLVVLSYVIACLGSFTGLRLATDIHTAPTRRLQNQIHIGGALSFGAGIWAMHFIGMLAYRMDMVHTYDPYLTAFSMGIAVAIAYAVLLIVRTGKIRVFELTLGAIILGFAICAMHYTGMAAMQMEADLRYIPSLFLYSILIAIAASGAALWIVFTLGQHQGRTKLFWQVIAALVMGGAICGMHYMGVEAAVFLPYADCRYDPDQSFDTLAMVVTVISALVFTIALTVSFQTTAHIESGRKNEKRYSGQGVFLQLSLLLSIFLVLIMASNVFLNDTLQAQKNGQNALNTAGLQRTLITRYVVRVSIIVSSQARGNWTEVSKHSRGLQSDKEKIEKNFQGLLGGGEVDLNVDEGRHDKENILILHQIEDPQIEIEIKNAYREWKSLRNLGVLVLQSDAVNMTDDKRYLAFERQLFFAVGAENEAVKSIQNHLQRVNEVLEFKQNLILVFAVITFLLTLLYARFFIVKPIERVQTQLQDNRDNLERRVIEQTKDIQASKEEAERANHAKSDFLANMSHELRAPLNSIIGMIQILDRYDLQSEVREMMSIIKGSSQNLLQIVNDVLDLSKIEAGEVHLENKVFDAAQTVRHTVRAMLPLARQKHLNLTCEQDQKALYVYGDQLRFTRIVTNLVGNAIRYTEDGSVNVVASVEETFGNSVRFKCEIIDTGIGIPKDKIDTIFDKFTQADATMTRRFGGTGLGLTITKELVALMDGQIGVESELDKGSVFWFEIPFDVAEKPNEEEIQKCVDVIGKRRAGGNAILYKDARILLAEDHDVNQIFMKKLFRTLDIKHYEIVENGKLAVKAVQSQNYDLVLMDCHMPEMNGYDATQSIRGLSDPFKSQIPIIAMTANAMPEDEEKCLSIGMDAYISKPVDIDIFKATLSQWIYFPVNDDGEVGDEEASFRSTINLDNLKKNADGDEDFVREMVGLFISRSAEKLDELKYECTDGENENWVEIAHSLKGIAGIVGAEEMRLKCGEAQDMKEALAKDRERLYDDIFVAYLAAKESLTESGYLNS